MELKPCPECGVPEIITGEHQWLNNGDIVQKRHQSHRMVFIETENLDPLFRGIAQIIGAEIEHMVITAGRRACRIYLEAFVPADVREKIQNNELDYEPIDAAFRDLAGLNGSGRYDFIGKRYEHDEQDYCTVSITNPYSIPMNVSAHIGAIECLTGVDQGYKYEEVSTDVYNSTALPFPHPVGFKDRYVCY